MDNHYHAVVETPEANLSTGMHRLNGVYAQRFNRRHELDGHLFQDRFHSVLVESDWHMLALARYVVLNPVRAGLCDRAEHWRWSSHRAIAGLVVPAPLLTVDWLLGYFGAANDRARAAYRSYVATEAESQDTVRMGHVAGTGPGTWLREATHAGLRTTQISSDGQRLAHSAGTSS